MTTILNLTQHTATPEQIAQGVIECTKATEVRSLITFSSIPSQEEMEVRAKRIAEIAKEQSCDAAMIGGAPYFMSSLEKALREVGVKPVYAFSIRESVEKTLPDGSVQKLNVFKHVGFVGL